MSPPLPSDSSTTRREFLQHLAIATTLATTSLGTFAASAQTEPATAEAPPWYSRTLRWGQTNITEADVEHYDIAWWRKHWKRTQLQGVVINAGGIVAYYPSKFPLHYRPPNLKGRDLFGELTQAAHEDGLVVFARMDSSKAHEAFYKANPDWFAVDANGQPYKSGEFFLSCINSPYYDQYLPDVMREISERSHPDGFTDNIWSGLDRASICYCDNCKKRFRKDRNHDLPARHDWNDTAFRQWIEWSYQRRIEQWELNNRVTREAGGKDCIWVGMNGSGILGGSSFRDMKEICARAPMIMLDNQSRSDGWGFQENALGGKLIHGLLGWDKLIPESMAMYQHGRPQYRFSSKSTPEVRMWMLAGFAGGIQPWWHHVGAYHEDRRMYRTAEPVMRWHRENEKYLVNRKPIANVALAWSGRNSDFFGRDNAEELVEQPFRGFAQAMVRARIPFVPLHLDHLDRDRDQISVLILPNIGAMSDEQIDSVRRFVQSGGALVATGQTSLMDHWGDARSDFALADLFGVKGGKPISEPRERSRGPAQESHTYLRLSPELRAQVDGPMHGDEPAINAKRHLILAGFEETDILPFGGTLASLSVGAKAQVLATFVPAFPSSPPETVWMRQPRTDIPAIVANESAPGRVVYLAADIDRKFANNNFPDHGDLLANAIRWAAKDNIPLSVQGAGLINCELYRQENRLILHVVNLTSAGSWRAPVQELIPIGPLQIGIRMPNGMQVKSCRTLVAGNGAVIRSENKSGMLRFELASIMDHEVVIIEA
ncbi:MAG TPA: beta-galactosidase [Tepidisphaeraceae bacterium]|jgi:hypothetical protein|nr:beta-galactosidase [Tepidisphaeraceae bacterium]